jgi:hypothetical protein
MTVTPTSGQFQIFLAFLLSLDLLTQFLSLLCGFTKGCAPGNRLRPERDTGALTRASSRSGRTAILL